MSAGRENRWTTHAIEMTADRVVKRFRTRDDGRAEREWRALTLLAAYAPGLAPEPLEADLGADEPVVVMSRLPGVPLRGAPLGRRQTAALAEVLNELYRAIPPEVVRGIRPRTGRQQKLVGLVRAWAVTVRPRARGLVGEAMDAGLAWLHSSGLEDEVPGEAAAVFGPGDGNLANYLWDGQRVRVVDFEDSGRTDRAFELAEIIEHVGSWVEHPLDVPAFLERIGLSPVETARLREHRRLLAVVWLFLLAQDDLEDPRNPPGTAERQSARLLDLLPAR